DLVAPGEATGRATFSLIGAPTGAGIDPDTGAFTWTPPDATPPGTYAFRVRVTDGGAPPRSTDATVTVALATAALDGDILMIGGTGGNDTIALNPTKDKASVVVTVNKQVVGTFAVGSVGRVT